MATSARQITGAHVRWAMIAFFAVIIGLDALFITFAVRSHPGEQVKNSYVLGLDYNRELERKQHQRALGWSMEAGLDDMAFAVRLRDAAGQPLEGLHVSAQMHVAGVRQDGDVVRLTERTAGEYVTPMLLEGPGRVEVNIVIRRAAEGDAVFEASKTLVLS